MCICQYEQKPVNEIVHANRRAARNGEGLGTPITSGGREVDVGGQCTINDRASFLPVKLSIGNLTNVWGPGYRWSA